MISHISDLRYLGQGDKSGEEGEREGEVAKEEKIGL